MSSIYSEEYQRVIRLLRETRLEKGITQEKLAQAFGRPQSFIAKVENGERRLDVVEFVHMAGLLSLNPAQILDKIKLKKPSLNSNLK
ncbi:helix-turn-helix domain-containing protein [Photorhabdus laumondii subsp. laumondii]|uniref:Photorhabdus luminescens subsp. laumondii TTO1 complete genome segment 10/17 n=2 Tax=Photorhabdus laumondii subsp. laumondii TaxID=141679 RepID=Q7N3K8_PHOLL|nr:MULTISPECIES: helix-turn-helix transcriptional regulator [Photorhabdus]AWK42440.1 transcriptional regulator [Photorhabdus laumondii subsp. laumondii]AXG47757.1 XRE family transcriptional regulator [Photorhabdus laumondii subsp. laumondii]KTL63553.1 DNA-binding protein [Photorhabdus laumondii subsp. laumondii]MBS9437379.1 XRE family transcriptional regulator [Photorhabdus noenieputensis]MCC8385415.1 helix-turn-helix transcriptional regulator [Photorhabdus laumondii]